MTPRVRKAEIREAALTLFAERGYHGTGMEDIAMLVGIRASSLYNHVPSKQVLLADIMRTTMHGMMLCFDEAVASAEDSQAALRRATEAHVRYHATHRREVRIGVTETHSLEEAAQGEVRHLQRSYVRKWQALIEKGVAEGVFVTPSAQLSAYAVTEMGVGVSRWFHEDGLLTLDEVARHYGTMALSQLGVTQPSEADDPSFGIS
jgi:AcrR family transcriptional regulator